MREFCHGDSSNIFPSWKYCVVSSFIWIFRHASFIFWISFSCFFRAHCCCLIDSWVAVVITLHLILIIPGETVFMREFRPFDDSNISSREYCCCFRFLSNVWDTRPLWFVWISFSWIFLSRMAASKRSMGVLGQMSATNITVTLFYLWASWWYYFDTIWLITVCSCFIRMLDKRLLFSDSHLLLRNYAGKKDRGLARCHSC